MQAGSTLGSNDLVKVRNGHGSLSAGVSGKGLRNGQILDIV